MKKILQTILICTIILSSCKSEKFVTTNASLLLNETATNVYVNDFFDVLKLENDSVLIHSWKYGAYWILDSLRYNITGNNLCVVYDKDKAINYDLNGKYLVFNNDSLILADSNKKYIPRQIYFDRLNQNKIRHIYIVDGNRIMKLTKNKLLKRYNTDEYEWQEVDKNEAKDKFNISKEDVAFIVRTIDETNM